VAKGTNIACYVTTFCNQGHRMKDGKPVDHECFVIPPAALEAERDGDYAKGIALMEAAKTAWWLGQKSLPVHKGIHSRDDSESEDER
jgi:hypothetical protein